MEFLVLDKEFETLGVLDIFDSVIWTDRYNRCGDFEFCLIPTEFNLAICQLDNYVYNPNSDHLMIIEGIEIKTDLENGNQLIITGRSLESLLERRIIWNQTILRGNFQNGIKRLLEENAISPDDSDRTIPNLIFEESTDSAITSLTISAQFTGDNLYEAIVELCDEKGVGFQITLNDQNEFVFSLYFGKDRSYNQNERAYVVFSPEFDNLLNTDYTETQKNLKTMALIAGEGQGADRRTASYGDDTATGLKRRELYVDARDISSQNGYGPNQYDGTYIDIGDGMVYIDDSHAIAALPAGAIKRTICVPCDPGTAYHIRSGIQSTLRIMSTPAIPVLGTIGNNFKEVTNHEYAVELDFTAAESDHYMVIQFFIDSDVTRRGANLPDALAGFFYGYNNNLPPAEYIAQLQERGAEKLSEYIAIETFDGETEVNIGFIFGVDYFIGDIVQIENEYGIQAQSRVSEYIISQDSSGYKAYPSFTLI